MKQATVTSWEIASFQTMGEYINVALENSTLGFAYIFMHQFIEAFGSTYVRESCIDHDVIMPL
jgi:hypothetical protein